MQTAHGLSALLGTSCVNCALDIILLFWLHVGSLLVACAHFGGYVLGSDIDMILVHGRGRQVRPHSQKRGWNGS